MKQLLLGLSILCTGAAMAQVGAVPRYYPNPGTGIATARTTTAARPVAAHASIGGIVQAIQMLYMDTGRLPTNQEGLKSLVQRPATMRNWKGPYVAYMSTPQIRAAGGPFVDPWGNAYQYYNTTQPGAYPSFQIRSYGQDGQPNTADDFVYNG